MLAFNRLIAVAMTAVLLGPMLPLDAKTKNGDKFLADGRIHEAKKEWDAALDSYKQALESDPGEMLYEMACDKARFQASQYHVENGLKIRSEGRLGEALLEFQKAVFINPGSVIAGQEMQSTQQMIMRERKRLEETGREAPPEIRALTPYQEARRQEDEKISRIQGIPELKPLDPQPFDFSLHGQKTKKAFEALGAIVRVNVLFDPEFAESGTPINVDLQKTTVEEALSYISTVTKSWWKVLSPNTIFVYNDNQNKRRDYEEMVTKVYYLQNVTQATELQEMQNILRTGCDINRVFPYNTGFALVVRGEADRVTLCEKLIRDIDKPKSEVLVDFLVMEASDTFNRQLAAAIASSGLNLPISFSPRSSIQVQSSSTSTSTTSSSTSSTSTTSTGSTVSSGSSSSTTGTQIPISSLGHLSSADFATTLPGALLQAAMSDSRSKVLQAPQIRAMDNVKATMNIGERVPVASGSYSPGVSGVGVSSLVNTQFNYQDVGVNVEMLARVLEGNEVYMNVKIDISNIDGYQTQSGISEPIIGQRKIQEDLRVREGEVALLGGVIKQQDDNTLTGVPGLMNIPILGKLFSGRTMDHSRNDLMIVLIPHIIRRPQYTADNVRALAVGNQTIMLRYAPPKQVEFPVDGQIPGKVDYAPVVPGNPAPPAASVPQGQPAMPSPAIVPPPGVPQALGGIGMAPQVTVPAGGAPPATAPPATAPPATAPPATAPPATAPPGDSANPAAKPADQPQAPPAVHVLFNPRQMESRINGLIPVSVVLEGGTDIAVAPMRIRFDPKMLKLNDAISGDLLGADGQTPLLTKNIQNDVGEATVTVSRTPGTGGVTRPSGALVTLIFQAIGRGTTTVTMPTIAILNAQGQPVPATGPQMIIETH